MNYTNLPFKASLLATTIALTACGGSSSSNPEGLSSKKEGTAVMSAKGGNAAYQAGDGGYINIEKRYSSAPLNITVRGLPDTKYKPLKVEAQLGTNPAVISASTTISADTGSLSSGDLYLYDNRIYSYDGEEDGGSPVLGSDHTEITGISIASDAVLTLDPNGDSTVYLYLDNDIQNDGEITVIEDAAATDVTNIRLYLNNYIGSGNIDLSGKVVGQNGGDLRITGNLIKNSGTIDTSGADGDDTEDAGRSGYIRLYSSTLSENTGSLLAKGGSSTGNQADSGSSVRIQSSRDSVNTGTIDTSAGSGVNGFSSYSAGNVDISAPNLVLNTGDITADGSDAILNAGGTNGGEGGEGGYIELYLGAEGAAYEMPRLINTGNLQTNGGDSIFDGYRAGNGGQVYIEIEESYAGDQVRSNPAVLAVSGNLTADGGHAISNEDTDESYAGRGGSIRIEHDSQEASELATYVVGYTSLDTSGGDGLLAGDAGGIELETESNSDEDDAVSFASAPPLKVTTNLIANGGTVVASDVLTDTAEGGEGGYIDLYITTEHSSLQKKLTLNLEADVSANASNITNGFNEHGGFLYIEGPQAVTVQGNINLNGGSDSGTENYNQGGEGGFTYIASEFENVTYKGDVSATGGNGENEGGNGGYFMVNSSTASKIKGTINLNGGNASPTEVEADETVGGNGGSLQVVSNDFKTKLSASYTIEPGTGSTPGIGGGVFVDYTCEAGTCAGNNGGGPF